MNKLTITITITDPEELEAFEKIDGVTSIHICLSDGTVLWLMGAEIEVEKE